MATSPRIARDCNTCMRHNQATELECKKFGLWDHKARRMLTMFDECLATPELKHWVWDADRARTPDTLSLPKK